MKDKKEKLQPQISRYVSFKGSISMRLPRYKAIRGCSHQREYRTTLGPGWKGGGQRGAARLMTERQRRKADTVRFESLSEPVDVSTFPDPQHGNPVNGDEPIESAHHIERRSEVRGRRAFSSWQGR